MLDKGFKNLVESLKVKKLEKELIQESQEVTEDLEDVAQAAEENYEQVPDEFIEYKYNDKLSDIRKDVDYFKGRLDSSESNEAKEKYKKLISELVDQEKELLGIADLSGKKKLDKQQYIADKVAQNMDLPEDEEF